MGERQNKQQELNDILIKLSKPCKDSITEIHTRLKNIYNSDFRHYYSALCHVIRGIWNDSAEALDCLTLNLDAIIENEQQTDKRDEEFLTKVRKLYDHINLELIRCNSEKSLELKLIDAEKALQDAKTKLSDANTELEKAKEQAEGTAKQLVTVLSIFSAIVIAFTGGISLLSGAFESLKYSNLLEIIILSLTVGGLLYNCIFLLLYYVAKITDKNIYSYCYKRKTICSVECEDKCNIVKRTVKKMPMLVFVNGLIVLSLIICSIVYQIT